MNKLQALLVTSCLIACAIPLGCQSQRGGSSDARRDSQDSQDTEPGHRGSQGNPGPYNKEMMKGT
jgi:hypothetical protein